MLDSNTDDLLLFSSVAELQLKGLNASEESWNDTDVIGRVFFSRTTELSGMKEVIIEWD